MPISRLSDALAKRLETLGQENRLKGDESVICGVVPARDGGGRAICSKARATDPSCG
jgi:hypothetical protein